MNTKHWLIIILLILARGASAQTCTHTGLSKRLYFKITRTIVNHKDDTSLFNESNILIEIYLKASGLLFQKIQFISTDLYSDDFKDCSNDRSLITGKNKNSDASDNDYGNIIVADFNFDGKEDFAIKNGQMGNLGVGYRFYIQTKKGFVEDKYLTDNVSFFPWLLNPKRHLLITIVSPTPGTTIRIYKYNSISKAWHQTGKRFVWHDKKLDYYLNRLKKQM
jgi:hypothetical protein